VELRSTQQKEHTTFHLLPWFAELVNNEILEILVAYAGTPAAPATTESVLFVGLHLRQTTAIVEWGQLLIKILVPLS